MLQSQIKIGVVIPTRGDRTAFLKQAKELLSKQTLAPDFIEIVDFKPKSNEIDIKKRYEIGCKNLFEKKCDVVIFWEDDDWYSSRYIEIMIAAWVNANKPAIFGIGNSCYYHIFANKYLIINHPGRASMMSTMVTKAILNIDWGIENDAYADVIIWKELKGRTFIPPVRICLGVKHGIGMTGGGGHDSENFAHYNKIDKERMFLRSVVGTDILFYNKLLTNLKK